MIRALTPAASPLWPVFVVSLSDATRRRALIARQLHDIGLPFEILDAVDGRTGLAAEYEDLVDRPGTLVSHGRRLTDAEYACAISHLKIWQRIGAEKLPGAIILEDDAILDRRFADFLKAEGYLAAALVMCDHLNAKAWKWAKPVHVLPDMQLVPIMKNASRCSGYSLSAKGAKFLVENSLPLRAPADWPCSTLPLRPLVAVPRLVDQPEEKACSVIANGRRYEKKRAKRKLQRFFQKRWWHRGWEKRVLTWFINRLS